MSSKTSTWKCESCGQEVVVHVKLSDNPVCSGSKAKHAPAKMLEKVRAKASR